VGIRAVAAPQRLRQAIAPPASCRRRPWLRSGRTQAPTLRPYAHRIQQPVLLVLGTASPAMFAERQKLLLHWLPNAEPLDLPGLTHLLHAQDPAAVADGLTRFFARHPIPETL
jgi:pimeloyl-ACP methyl ester carboxylesterase